MWSNMTLRIKITVLTVVALTVTALGMTFFANFNAHENVLTPLRELEFIGLERQVYFLPWNEIRQGNMMEGDFGQGWQLHPINNELFQAQSDFQIFSFAIALGFIILGTLVAYIISGQALKPIKSLATEMEKIDVNNLSKKVVQSNTNDEVSRLTNSFNNMLSKLNNSFEMQKLFAQNAAHELKTPLTAIRANIEVLNLGDEPSITEYKEVLNTVANDTEQLIELVEGLLSFNNECEKEVNEIFDIRILFEEILDKLKTDVLEKELQVDISGQADWSGDKTLLEQAFFNLVHNAIRYNVENGTVKITLDKNRVIIDDTGSGIPFKDLKQIFNPFYCVDSSRSKDLGGHGLGLSITKNILDKHEMDIQIFSKVGKGTKILISQ